MKTFKKLLELVIVGLLFAVTACNNSGTNTPKLEEVTFNNMVTSMTKGDILAVEYSKQDGVTATFESSNESVATVEDNIITAVEVGNFTLTATFKLGEETKKYEFEIDVIIIESSITYELNEGVLPSDAPTTYVEGSKVTLPVPTKEGYEFLGWTKEAESTDYITEISASETAEVKVYAQWKQKEQQGEVEGAVYVGAGLDYATLDEAVAGAPEGSKIILAAGEYVLSIVVAKSLEIIGPNANLPVSQFSENEALIAVSKDVAGNIAAANIVFNGVHLKGTGGGGGISGVFFQDGGNIETLTFKSCVVSDMNTFIKFNGATSKSTVIIENSHLHTIGQFMVWVQNAQTQKVILRSNVIDASNCGGVTNTAAALFRVRSGSLEAYDNLFKGDSLNAPGYFELSAADGNSTVKYNTFDGVTKYVHPSANTNAVFDENLYLDAEGAALAASPVAANGVTADATVAANAEDLQAKYEAYACKEIEYVLDGGVLPEGAATQYEEGVELALPTPTKDSTTQIRRNIRTSQPKYSATPAHTPPKTLSLERNNFFIFFRN